MSKRMICSLASPSPITTITISSSYYLFSS